MTDILDRINDELDRQLTEAIDRSLRLASPATGECDCVVDCSERRIHLPLVAHSATNYCLVAPTPNNLEVHYRSLLNPGCSTCPEPAASLPTSLLLEPASLSACRQSAVASLLSLS